MDVKKSFSLFVLLLALLLAACLKDDVKPSNGIEFVRIGEGLLLWPMFMGV